jgi:hypothetical protein
MRNISADQYSQTSARLYAELGFGKLLSVSEISLALLECVFRSLSVLDIGEGFLHADLRTPDTK